jgi:hypothetical protein
MTTQREGAGHRNVNAVIFDVQLPMGTMEVIGVPFEHNGILYAVHRPPFHDPLAERYEVSHVESGRAVVKDGSTIDGARESAIALLEHMGEAATSRAIRKVLREGAARSPRSRGKRTLAA